MGKHLQIRRARGADAPACAAVVFAALREHGIEPEPEGADRDVFGLGSRSGRFVDLVAERDGEIVGVACLEPWSEAGWISKLFVARAARGEGLGRALLARLLDEARAQGMTSVGLRTRSVFQAAIRLYEGMGFEREPAHGDGGDRGNGDGDGGDDGEERVYALALLRAPEDTTSVPDRPDPDLE